MKKFILAIAMGASALTAMPAAAQSNREDRQERREDRQDRKEDRREDRRENRADRRDDRADRHDDRRNVRQNVRQDAWRTYNRYDYNRPGPQGRYFAENYYRDGRYYRPVRLTRNDRIYRGRDNRYYCRRSDGTTGLIIGAALGGVIGNRLDQGGSSILGTLLGLGAGAAIGSSIDRGQVVCR
jgi:Ni/Co efflux regulator RcnB